MNHSPLARAARARLVPGMDPFTRKFGAWFDGTNGRETGHFWVQPFQGKQKCRLPGSRATVKQRARKRNKRKGSR